MSSKLFLAAGIFLAGCHTPQPTIPEPPAPVVAENQDFACDQIRSGASIQELVDHELDRGMTLEAANVYIIKSVDETCPEFQILIEEHFTD